MRAMAADLSPQGHSGRLVGGARCVAAPFPGAVVQPAVVEGTVRDETGVPLGGVKMRLRKGDGDAVSIATRQDGRYALAVFEAGTYTLEAELGNAYRQWTFVHEKGARQGYTDYQAQEVHLEAGEILYQDLNTPSSQVAWWRGEGDARDAVGPHHGILKGGATFLPGLVGQAFSLDGVDDYVLVADASRLNVTGSFSVVAWVFPSVANRIMSILRRQSSSVLYDYAGYALFTQPGLSLNFGISDDAHQLDGEFQTFLSPTNVLTRNAWNQVAAIYDQDTGTRYIYANGVEIARREDPPITLPSNKGDLILGAWDILSRDGSIGSFQGLIDEVSIYQRALAEVAIQRLYSTCAEARWPGQGNASDSRGTNHGILVKNVGFAPGLLGQAFSFDGQGSYVQFNSLIGSFGTADFSIELWLWYDRAYNISQPLLVTSFDQSYLTGVKYFPSANIVSNEVDSVLDLHLDASGHVQVELNSGHDINRLSSAQALSVQTWHHLALVRQGREVRLYLNGRLDTLKATTRVVDLMVPTPMTLGGSPVQERYFAGLIDEVALHNKALAPAAIDSTYQTVLSAWRWRLWSGRLQQGGIVLVIVLALFSSARYYTQRRARRQREVQLAEERQAREEERRAREIADAANQAKSAFLANMSHEIRTPMNAILGYAQILLDREVLSDEQQERAVKVIHSSGIHLLGLINDVLDLSKIEAGRMEVEPVDFDLGQLVDGLANMFELRCQQKGLGWRVERKGENWQVHGDGNKLRQVLVNLLGNAVKFTDSREVVLRVEMREGNRCYFEVLDTGPGIDLQQQKTVFEPFQQGASGAHKGGTGLGLSIVRRHVELMGGQMQLESKVGKGTRFFFLITLQSAQGAADVSSRTPRQQVVGLAAGYAPQVLIVDDVATNREILAQMLERIGVQVRQADSGAAALAVVVLTARNCFILGGWPLMRRAMCTSQIIAIIAFARWT
jgi:signal transduction histidine kinase